MEKLYEENPYLTRFTAAVELCRPGEGGWEVILDRTAFYPEGGGQPWDLGRLGGAEVTRVRLLGDRVVHTCSAPLEPGTRTEGEIDWPRRFDLMQNHSGEHIVSGIAHEKWGCENVGFHMGAETVAIDFDRALAWEQLAVLEEAANRYIWEDRPVSVRFPEGEELERTAYRSKKALTGRVRIVSFPGADVCACCGTHVSSAGQVGLVKLLSLQKLRGGVRIELVCGGRALKYLSGVWEQNRQVSNLLSAKPLETGAAAERLLEENAGLKERAARLEQEQFEGLAGRYAGAGDVVLFQEGLTPGGLRRLCAAVLERCGGRCACFSGADGAGWQYAVGEKGGDLRPLAKELNRALEGRGGGKPDFVQGAVRAGRREIEAFFASFGG